jgi:hypothetical protein
MQFSFFFGFFEGPSSFGRSIQPSREYFLVRFSERKVSSFFISFLCGIFMIFHKSGSATLTKRDEKTRKNVICKNLLPFLNPQKYVLPFYVFHSVGQFDSLRKNSDFVRHYPARKQSVRIHIPFFIFL